MITLLDGPAADRSLALRRAPVFLRVVEKPRARKDDNRWDALDLLSDVPHSSEKIHVYFRVTYPRWLHMKCSPRSASGYYAIANYRYVVNQPADAVVRDTERWRQWCRDEFIEVLAEANTRHPAETE
jgi:hypothetical protein